MTAWASILLPFLVAVLWLFVPAAMPALALRLRPSTALGTAPLVSMGIICIAAILAPPLGMRWGPLPVVLITGLLWLPFLLIELRRRRRRLASPEARGPRPPAPRGGGRARVLRGMRSVEAHVAVALLLAAILMARHVRNVLDRPDAFSQTFDNVFHLSAVRWILDTGDASSLHLMGMTAAPGDGTFYPAAWHDLVSLILTTLGSTEIPHATNGALFAVCALVWPTGGLLLVRACLPSSLERWGLIPAGVLVASLPMFPVLFLGFGVLYPNLLSLALLPALLALLLRVAGISRLSGLSYAAVVVIGLLGSIGIALAHPNAAMTLLALAVPVFLVAALRSTASVLSRRTRTPRWAPLALLALAGAAQAAARLAWPVVRPPEENATWHPVMSISEAVGQAVLLNPRVGPPAWVLTLLLVSGAYVAVRRRRLEMLGAWLVTVHLWIAIAAWEFGDARTALVGIWYNDPYRLAAVLAIPSLPLIALGAASLLRAIGDATRALGRIALRRARIGARRPLVLALLGTALIALLTQRSPWLDAAVDSASANYELGPSSQLVNSDERALLSRLHEHVPAGAVIATDSWNGSSLAYPLEGVRTTSHHTLEHETADDIMVNDHLDEAATDPRVCAALDRLGSRYVLDFGDQQVNGSQAPRVGFERLSTADGFELVDQEGDAALYRITACD